MCDSFERRDDPADSILGIHKLHKLPKFETGNAPDFWLDVVDVLEQVSEDGAEPLGCAQYLRESLQLRN
jgi:hypothetical protein